MICLDDEQLAAYVDHRLDAETRRTLEAHLAECSRCRDLLAETVAVLDTDDRRGRILPMWRRTWPRAAAAAAIAATVMLLARVTFVTWRRATPPDRPELAELVAAAAQETTRLTEGRLTGGFPYKPSVGTRGNERRVSPEVRIAAARIEQAARGHDDAASDAALGTSFLALGDWDRAVEQLESAVDAAPDNARFQNDLAVAYIARASTTGRADDWPKAYAAAERAAKRDPQLIEPCFNRALALEGLTLMSEAAEGWTSCADRDRGSLWAAEARARAKTIRDRLEAGKNQPRSRQQDREEIEDRVLVRWAEAERAGAFAEADGALADAERLARALADAGGDTMARDEVMLIRKSPRGSRARADLVEAHLAYGRARKAFVAERLRDTTKEMDAAAVKFAHAHSNYQYWAPIFRAISLWVNGFADKSLAMLSSVPIRRMPDSYYHLRGRLAWTEAAALSRKGMFDLELPVVERARDLFRRAGEIENASLNAAAAAEADSFVGTQERMWAHMLEAVAQVDVLPPGGHRSSILEGATYLALRDGLPEAALAFQDHVLGAPLTVIKTKNELLGPTPFIRRGQTLGRMGQTEAALDDLRRATAAAQQLQDSALRDWMVAETDAVRAEILTTKDPRAAIQAADAALEYRRRLAFTAIRESELLVSRARAHETLGELAAAAEDYQRAIAAIEEDQDNVARPQQRKAAYEQQRMAVRDAVRFHAVIRGDSLTALGIAERARARVLRQTLAGATASAPNPALVHRSLPQNIAILYYVTLVDRVLGWVLTTDQSFNFTQEVDSRYFRRVMHRVEQRIADNATADDLAPELQYLQTFVRPALPALTPGTTLVIIPDEGMESIPFAAVPDLNGEPLVANYPMLLAPSYSTLMLASKRLAAFEPHGVVAIGDGHDPSNTGLARLKYADAEAAAVARLYPRGTVFTGFDAKARHLLADQQPVLHFAGHTINNPTFPFLSRLLFSPDRTHSDESGVLLASDIADHRLSRTKVVVLATCESAAGRFNSTEGFDNLARFFLDAGVPAIVASLWRVDDDASSILIEFHRQLRSTRDVATSLRAAQMKEVRDRADLAPLKRWAGFVAFGGVNATWNTN